MAVGHSMGGAVALELALGWPELVRSVVALDTTMISSPERKTKLLPAMLENLHGPECQEAARRFAGGMFLPSDDGELKRWVQQVMAGAPRHVLIELTRALMAWDGPGALARLARPMLYVGSRRPLTAQGPMLEASPWVHYAQTAGSGHFMTLIVPEQVNAMIERWLEVLPSTEAEA